MNPEYRPPVYGGNEPFNNQTGLPLYPPPAPPKKKHTVRNVLLIVAAGLVALCGVGTIVTAATSSGKPAATHQVLPSPTAQHIKPVEAEPSGPSPDVVTITLSPPAPSPTGPKLTASQQQALVMAHEYLATQSFSRTGLIKQLQYEGFSAADATYGTDAVGADWTAQADAMAKEYLSTQAFSRSGLIKQLEYEGFTAAQAQHGATAAGL